MKKLSSLAMMCLVPVLLTACDRGGDAVADRQGESPAATPDPAAPSTVAPAPRFSTLEVSDPAVMIRVPCALDKINDQRATPEVVNLEAGAGARFSGWISDSARKVPASFKIVLKGATSYGAEMKPDRTRPDVARALNAPALANSGFNGVVSMADVAPGQYEVGLLVQTGAKPAYCRTRARVEVVNAPG